MKLEQHAKKEKSMHRSSSDSSISASFESEKSNCSSSESEEDERKKKKKGSWSRKIDEMSRKICALYQRGKDQACRRIPTVEEIPSILEGLHEEACGGHFAQELTAKKILLSGYVWPSLHIDVQHWCKSCHNCQVNENKHLLHGPRQLLLANGPFEKWGIDAMGPLPRTKNGKLYILVAIDYMTRWVEAQSVTRVNEKTVSRFVYTHICCRFGTPLEIVFDNGPGFRKGLLTEVCEELHILHRHSTPYNPQSNGLVEKANGIIAGIIRKMVKNKTKLWDDFLDGALWAYRTTYKEATEFTPFHLVYGQEALQPIELNIPTMRLHGKAAQRKEEEWTDRLLTLAELEWKREAAYECYKRKATQVKDKLAKEVKDKGIKEGDLVLRYDNRLDNRFDAKFETRWQGPYIVKKAFNSSYYQLMDLDGKEHPRKVNGYRLKPYLSRILPKDLQDQRQKSTLSHKSCSFVQEVIANGPFEKWGIDAMGPLPRTTNGKLYILVAIDYMTRFGTPLEIVSDNGPGFRKSFLTDVCEELKISHRHSTPYYPQSNGLVEKANGIIAGIIRKMVESKPKRWDNFLDGAIWAYITTYRDATQFTPFHLVYGQEALQPIELNIPTIKLTDRQEQINDEAWIDRLLSLVELEWKREAAYHCYERKALQLKDKLNEGLKDKEIKEKSLVLRYNNALDNRFDAMFEHRWEGPFIVKKDFTGGYYHLMDLNGKEHPRKVNGYRLKPYLNRILPAVFETKQISKKTKKVLLEDVGALLKQVRGQRHGFNVFSKPEEASIPSQYLFNGVIPKNGNYLAQELPAKTPDGAPSYTQQGEGGRTTPRSSTEAQTGKLTVILPAIQVQKAQSDLESRALMGMIAEPCPPVDVFRGWIRNHWETIGVEVEMVQAYPRTNIL
ncbi:hypothetical protein L7F22_067535 [Adiantum nelumboides]|nr:hypothetical protein [Adiantum nelumboides]